MREIKFRAWDCYNYKMIESHEPILFNRIIPLCYPHNHFKDKDGGAKECFLMQFTGLKDVNGVDIYEGDIVSISYDGEPGTIHKVYWGGVEYPAFELNPELGAECNGFSEIYCAGDYELKVIGNIHQHGDLLECK